MKKCQAACHRAIGLASRLHLSPVLQFWFYSLLPACNPGPCTQHSRIKGPRDPGGASTSAAESKLRASYRKQLLVSQCWNLLKPVLQENREVEKCSLSFVFWGHPSPYDLGKTHWCFPAPTSFTYHTASHRPSMFQFFGLINNELNCLFPQINQDKMLVNQHLVKLFSFPQDPEFWPTFILIQGTVPHENRLASWKNLWSTFRSCHSFIPLPHTQFYLALFIFLDRKEN